MEEAAINVEFRALLTPEQVTARLRRDLEAFRQPSNRIEPVIRPRALEQEWLRRNEAKYAGVWVALQGADLVAQGTSPREVLEAARSQGVAQPLVVHVPKGPKLPFGGW